MKLFVYIWPGYKIEIFAESREEADAFLKPTIDKKVESREISRKPQSVLVYRV